MRRIIKVNKEKPQTVLGWVLKQKILFKKRREARKSDKENYQKYGTTSGE